MTSLVGGILSWLGFGFGGGTKKRSRLGSGSETSQQRNNKKNEVILLNEIEEAESRNKKRSKTSVEQLATEEQATTFLETQGTGPMSGSSPISAWPAPQTLPAPASLSSSAATAAVQSTPMETPKPPEDPRFAVVQSTPGLIMNDNDPLQHQTPSRPQLNANTTPFLFTPATPFHFAGPTHSSAALMASPSLIEILQQREDEVAFEDRLVAEELRYIKKSNTPSKKKVVDDQPVRLLSPIRTPNNNKATTGPSDEFSMNGGDVSLDARSNAVLKHLQFESQRTLDNLYKVRSEDRSARLLSELGMLDDDGPIVSQPTAQPTPLPSHPFATPSRPVRSANNSSVSSSIVSPQPLNASAAVNTTVIMESTPQRRNVATPTQQASATSLISNAINPTNRRWSFGARHSVVPSTPHEVIDVDNAADTSAYRLPLGSPPLVAPKRSALQEQLAMEKVAHRAEEINRLLQKMKLLAEADRHREERMAKEIADREEQARKQKEKEEAESAVRPLSSEQLAQVKKALKGNEEEVVLQHGNIDLKRYDLLRLTGTEWLNDEVINLYMVLLKEREVRLISGGKKVPKCHFWSTFFYTSLVPGKGQYDYKKVCRWTRKLDMFSLDKVIVPVHLGVHWCVAVVNFRDKQIEYYDSLKGDNSECLTALKRWVNDEHQDKKGKPYEGIEKWNSITPKRIPAQRNGYDCGVFLCKFAECLSIDKPLRFTQEDMPTIRDIMIYQTINKRVD